jgi:hypothetical protein
VVEILEGSDFRLLCKLGGGDFVISSISSFRSEKREAGGREGKGRGNHERILCLGRKPRRGGLKAEPGRGFWRNDKPPILILGERKGSERYVPSTDVKGETIGRIASSQGTWSGAPIYTRRLSILHGPLKP